MKTGIELIAEERERQINQEGWSIVHDSVRHKVRSQVLRRKSAAMSALRKEQYVRLAIQHLREARDLFVKAGSYKAARRVYSAIRSADGALRNVSRFAAKAETEATQ